MCHYFAHSHLIVGFMAVLIGFTSSAASAMLAGILLHFCLNVFTAMQSQLFLVLSMLIVYLCGKRFWPRFCLLIALLIGIIVARFFTKPIANIRIVNAMDEPIN